VPSASRSLLLLVVAWKALLFAILEVCRQTTFGWFNAAVWNRNFHFWPAGARPSSLAMYATWDAQHYLALATQGYARAGISMVFFPGWPAAIALAGSNPATALGWALVLSNVCSALALVLLHRWVKARADRERADRTIVLLLCFPTAFFLCVPYSEGLFLLLSVACLQTIEQRRFGVAAGLALLATFVRAPGICLAVPLLYTIAVERRWRALPLVAAPALAVVARFLYVRAVIADPAQLAEYTALFVAHQSPWNFIDLPRLLGLFVQPLRWHGVVDSAIDRALFVGTLAATLAFGRATRDRALLLYTLALLWISGTGPSLVSFSRYALCAVPLFLFLADRLQGRRWATALYVAIALPLQLVFFLHHIHNY